MRKKGKPVRLLIVDEEDDFRAATARVLCRRGFHVIEAASIEGANEAMKETTPDIALLGLKMEGMEGVATLERLRQSHPRLPVIILTGHGGFDEALAGISLDIVDFVQKPVDVDALAERIHRRVELEHAVPLREKTIAELMVSASEYKRAHMDERLETALATFRSCFGRDASGHALGLQRCAVLVYDLHERFVGLLRVHDVMRAVLPPILSAAPYSAFHAGMFLAQCKVLGQQKIGSFLVPEKPVDITTPLTEAVHAMVSRGVVNLPIARGGDVVGVLRDKDVLVEIVFSVMGM